MFVKSECAQEIFFESIEFGPFSVINMPESKYFRRERENVSGESSFAQMLPIRLMTFCAGARDPQRIRPEFDICRGRRWNRLQPARCKWIHIHIKMNLLNDLLPYERPCDAVKMGMSWDEPVASY